MKQLLLFCAAALVVLSLACSKAENNAGLVDPKLTYDDLVDAWKGTLETWRVDNTAAGKPSFTLNNVDVNLIIDTQTYWLQLSYFTDSLEYQYYNRGYWLWDPYVPDVMVFEIYYESSTAIKNPIRSSVPDSISEGGQGGSNGGGGSVEPPDTTKFVKGDNTKMEDRFISYMDYNEDTIRLYDFIEYLNLGDVTLERY
jgi:hypothetical protein